MPFFLFQIPILERLLTHTIPTAYDRRGRCVAFIGPERPKDESEEKKKWVYQLKDKVTQQLSDSTVKRRIDEFCDKIGNYSNMGGINQGPTSPDDIRLSAQSSTL